MGCSFDEDWREKDSTTTMAEDKTAMTEDEVRLLHERIDQHYEALSAAVGLSATTVMRFPDDIAIFEAMMDLLINLLANLDEDRIARPSTG